MCGTGNPGQDATLQAQEERQQQIVTQTRQEELVQEPAQTETEQQRLDRERRLEEAQRQIETDRMREERIRRVRESCRVILPAESIMAGSYAHRYTENHSAGKRRRKSHLKGSALRVKRLNAETLENARDFALKERERLLLSCRKRVNVQSEANARDLSYFLKEGQEDRNLILMGGAAVQGPVTDAAGRECVRQIMEMDLGNLSFATDQAVAQNGQKLEEISGKMQAMRRLLERCPGIRELLTEEERTGFDTKMEQVYYISTYYELRKKIITNRYYRTHYQSEISDRFDRRDSLEQKNLTFLLWQAEYRLSDLDRGQRHRWMFNDIQTDSRPQETPRIREKTRPCDPEYGKNKAYIEDSLHAAYFRQHDREGDLIWERLKWRNYQVSGTQETMRESLLRYLSNLPRWKAAQHLSVEEMQRMVENLASWPENPQDAAETERCRKRNLEGLAQYKSLLARQMSYLRVKYGNGFSLADSEVLTAHAGEFENDFTNMQGLVHFVEYLKKIPGMFNEMDPQDAELERSVEYYNNIVYAEGIARNVFVDDQSTSYAYYKKLAAVNAIPGSSSAQMAACINTINMEDTMHLGIRWDTVFDESDIRLSELITQLAPDAFAGRLERTVKELSDEEKRSFCWTGMFPELKGLSGPEAVKRLVEKEMPGLLTPEVIRQKRSDGLTIGAISIPGVGTDDLFEVKRIYQRILENPEIRADYGLADEADFEEFQTHLKREEDIAEQICISEVHSELALRTGAAVEEAARKLEGSQRAIAMQMSAHLMKAGTAYTEETQRYRAGEGSRIYREFNEFRSRVGMMFYPEHRSALELLETLAESRRPDMEYVVSGIPVRSYAESPLAEFLQNGSLREEVNPEDFEAAVREFNPLYARHIIYSRITSTGEEADSREAEPLWRAIPHKRAFFQYDIFNRQSQNTDQWELLLNKIKGMLK